MDAEAFSNKLKEMHDIYAPLIGKINIAWGNVQFWVFAIFYYLMGNDPVRSDPLFFALRSDSAQRDITIALIDAVLPHSSDKNLQADAKTAVGRLDTLAGQRNAVIHAMWSITLEGEPRPFARSSPRLVGKPLKETLEATYTEIIGAQGRLSEIATRVRETLPSLRTTLLPPPGWPAPN